MVNLTSFLDTLTDDQRKHLALHFPPDEQFTFQALDTSVRHFAAGLKKLAFMPGERIGLSLGNSPEFVIAFLAIMRCGMIVVPLNVMLQRYELEHQLMDSGAVCLIGNKRFIRIFEEIPTGTTCVHHCIIAHRDTDNALSWEGIDLSAADSGPSRDVDGETIAQITYTAAMDGYPRGAMLTHASLLANCAMNQKAMQTTSSDRYLSAIPLYHTYGAMATCIAPLLCGASVFLQPRFNPKEFLMALEGHKITVINGVPTVFAALLSHDEFSPEYFATVRLMIAGGAAMPLQISQRYRNLGLEILQGYGLTECSPAVTVNPIRGENKLESIGLPLIDVEMKIVDDAGNEVPAGEEGELLVKGPLTMKGYWNDPDLTSQTLRNGWLHTGDKARKDNDGYYYLTGLFKDMLITGGFNVYPREVERLFMLNPAIDEVKVTDIPDLAQGQLVKAMIRLKPGFQASERDLIHYAKRTMAMYKVPRVVEFLH